MKRDAAVRRVVPLADLTLADADVAGGKGANLGELIHAGFRVPEGFVVTTAAFLEAMDAGGVRQELRERTAQTVRATDPTAAAPDLQDLVHKAGVPAGLRGELVDAYRALGQGVSVAVRSSAAGEDSASTSFAGMNETFTNVSGDDELVARVVDCWASLFAARVCAYRASQEITAEPALAVIVQRMVASDRSGVMFTVDPATGDRSRIVIEGAYGLGEVVVSGSVEPDTYVVTKDGPSVVSTRLGSKAFRVVRGPDGHDRHIKNDPADTKRPALEAAEVLELARIGARVEEHYGVPQDTEWAIEGDTVYLVQSRPITTLDGGADAARSPGSPVVSGLSASPGVVVGRVRVLWNPTQGEELEAGEILVAPMTNPDWVPAIRRAAALVTDSGGITCHAAIVSRELGVPCVVGTRRATQALHDGMVVTVDAEHGTVYAGDQSAQLAPERSRAPEVTATASATTAPAPAAVTATRIYVNLAIADQAERVAQLPVDGVGLLRAEFMVSDALGGVHPRQLMAEGREREFVDAMAASLSRITRAFAPRPVVYRTIDFRTNEFRGLEGGAAFEPHEANPMIGYRGCYRYVREPDLFRLELEILARVRDETPNLHLMIPFVRTRWELEACLELVDASPLGAHRGMHRWVMAEVPSVVYRIPEYAALGIDGVSIGSNDLTQLMLGVDRDSEICAELFDESDAAVLDAIERIITAATRRGDHVVVVRPGPVEPARVRRAPGPLRDHVHLGEPRRGAACPPGGRGRRAPCRARRRAARVGVTGPYELTRPPRRDRRSPRHHLLLHHEVEQVVER